MSEEELARLKEKKAEYEEVLDNLRKRRDKMEAGTPRRQVLEGIIRSLENQEKMIGFAIYDREREK